MIIGIPLVILFLLSLFLQHRKDLALGLSIELDFVNEILDLLHLGLCCVVTVIELLDNFLLFVLEYIHNSFSDNVEISLDPFLLFHQNVFQSSLSIDKLLVPFLGF